MRESSFLACELVFLFLALQFELLPNPFITGVGMASNNSIINNMLRLYAKPAPRLQPLWEVQRFGTPSANPSRVITHRMRSL